MRIDRGSDGGALPRGGPAHCPGRGLRRDLRGPYTDSAPPQVGLLSPRRLDALRCGFLLGGYAPTVAGVR